MGISYCDLDEEKNNLSFGHPTVFTKLSLNIGYITSVSLIFVVYVSCQLLLVLFVPFKLLLKFLENKKNKQNNNHKF